MSIFGECFGIPLKFIPMGEFEQHVCKEIVYNLVPVLEEVNGFLVGLTCGLFWFCWSTSYFRKDMVGMFVMWLVLVFNGWYWDRTFGGVLMEVRECFCMDKRNLLSLKSFTFLRWKLTVIVFFQLLTLLNFPEKPILTLPISPNRKENNPIPIHDLITHFLVSNIPKKNPYWHPFSEQETK